MHPHRMINDADFKHDDLTFHHGYVGYQNWMMQQAKHFMRDSETKGSLMKG